MNNVHGLNASRSGALRDAEEARALADALFEAAPGALLELEATTLKVLRANGRAAGLAGLSAAELAKSTLFDLLPAADRATLREAVVGFHRAVHSTFSLETCLDSRVHAQHAATSDWQGKAVTLTVRAVMSSAGLTRLIATASIDRALALEGRRLTRVFDNASIALVERDIDSGRFTRVNAPFCRMVGYSEAELLSKTLLDITPDDDREVVCTRLQRLVAGEMTEYTAMKPLRCADGSLRWVLGTVSLLSGDDGEPDRLVTLYINVSDVVEARAALGASEERYRTLVDTMPDALMIVDTAGETLFVNRASAKLLGQPAQHWLEGGQPAISGALDAPGVEVQRQFWAHFEMHGLFDETPFDRVWLRRDARRTLEHRVANLRDGSGSVIGAMVVLRDVTDERLARVDRERIAAIVEASEDAIFSVSREHVVESWNSGCARLFALRPWVALARPLDSLFPADDQQALAAMIEQTIAGQTVDNALWPGRVPGPVYWVVSMRPIRDNTGRVCSVAVIVRDVSAEHAATAALEAEREYIRTVLDTLPVAVSVRDPNGQVLLANRRFEALYAGARTSTIGTRYIDRKKDPAEAELLTLSDLEILHTGQQAQYARRIVAPDGSTIDLQILKVPIRVGGSLHVLTTSVDVTALRKAEFDLRREREFMRTVIDTDPTLIYVKDAQGKFLLANRAVAASLGRTVRELEGHRLAELHFDPAIDAEYSIDDNEVLRGRRAITREECHRDAAGNERWFSSTRLPLSGAEGESVVLGVSTDITEMRRQARRIHELTNFDPLTGLPNRMLIEDRLQMSLAAAERDNGRVAVMFVDLDHFKAVNDSLGHPVGDRLLVAVANRMRAALRDADSIGRLGGDEFLIVLPQTEHADAAAAVAQKLLNALEEAFDVQGHSLGINASIGIALFPEDGTTPHLLVQNADTAMYHAKEQGRAGFRFFTRALNLRAARALAIEHGIQRGLRQGEFELWYQSIHLLADGTAAGLEALIRWRRSSGEIWSQGEFLGIAEERGLIDPIGRWVLREAGSFAARRRADGHLPLPVAINLSPRQLRQPDLVDLFRTTIEAFELPPGALEIEVTENSIMEDLDAATEVLRALRALGVTVSLDDFGTGHSSLAALRHLPVDRLKIDRSLVAQLSGNEVDGAIFAAIVHMAHALGMNAVAKGVETSQQLEQVRALGCDLGQGYLFSRPLPPAELSVEVDTPGAFPRHPA